MTTKPPLVPEKVEELRPGVVCEWFSQGRIIAYRLTKVSQAVVTDWMNLALQQLAAWDKKQPYLALHDLSTRGISVQYATLVEFDLMNIGITPAGRDQAQAIFEAHPSFRARVAIGFNLSVSGQVSQVVMDRIRSQHPSVQYKAFFNRDQALAWLQDGIAPASGDSDGGE